MKKKVYVVTSLDQELGMSYEKATSFVYGVYPSVKAAVKAGASYMMERIDLRDDLRYALMHDGNHPDLKAELSEASGFSEDELEKMFSCPSPDYQITKEVEDMEAELRKLLEEELEWGEYCISTCDDDHVGTVEFSFVITETEMDDEE